MIGVAAFGFVVAHYFGHHQNSFANRKNALYDHMMRYEEHNGDRQVKLKEKMEHDLLPTEKKVRSSSTLLRLYRE